jgi:hypothetical protein
MPTAAAIQSLLTRWSGDPLIWLLTIFHPQLDTILVARNSVGVTSRGGFYSAAPFDIAFVTDNDELPSMNLTVLNVDREIGRALLRVTSPAIECNVEAVLASNLDEVVRRAARFELHGVQFNQHIVSGTLSHKRLTSEPYPNKRVIPSKFPGYFR